MAADVLCLGARLALLGEGVASKRGKCSVEPEAHRGRMEAIQNVCVWGCRMPDLRRPLFDSPEN